MNWKRNSWTLLVAGLFVAGFTNCSDWTETDNEWVLESGNTVTNKPESYYHNLRTWKASDHSISFGWYSGWGEPTVSTTNMLAGIPDSMDIVSLWGNWSNLSEGKIKDLREVQQKKGTKVVFCSFTSYVGQNFTPAEYNTDEATRNEFWGWKEGDSEAINAGQSPNMQRRLPIRSSSTITMVSTSTSSPTTATEARWPATWAACIRC